MERGSYCYFCGTQLVRVDNDPFGGCYECFKCPPVTHWRWNEDTEFLQLYVAGERCPYCHLQVPDGDSEARTPVERHAPIAPAPVPIPAQPEAPASGTPPPATPAPVSIPAQPEAPASVTPPPATPAPVSIPAQPEAPASVAPPPVTPTPVAIPAQPDVAASVIESQQSIEPTTKKPGKPVTVDDVLWASVVEWCRAHNGHDTRKPHNCSKELARRQSKSEAVVVWHNRDRVPGTGELIQA